MSLPLSHLLDTLSRSLANCAFFTLDGDGLITSWNSGASGLYGRTAEAALGQPCSGLWMPSDVAAGQVTELLAQASAGGTATIEGWQVAEGRARFRARMTVNRLAPAAPPAFLVVVQGLPYPADPVELFRALGSRAHCLLWYGEVIDRGAPFPAWRIQVPDLEAAQRFLRLDIPAGQNYIQAFFGGRPPEDQERANRFGAQEVLAGRSYVQEYRCRDHLGRLRWVREDVEVEPLQPGRWRAVGICTDITEAKRAREADAALMTLGERLNRLESAAEAGRMLLEVADGLFQWDACWLELWRPGAISSDLLILMDLVDGERRVVPSYDSGVEAALRAQRAAALGARLILRDPQPDDMRGLPFGDLQRPSASLMYVPIRLGEVVIGILSVQSYRWHAYAEADLQLLQALADYGASALERTRSETVRRQLEAQLLEARKLEAVGRLAGGVAHDFNNMLAVINGYSCFLLDTLSLENPVRDSLQEISRAGERAAALTQQLLAFSRKQILLAQTLDLNQEVRRVETALRELVGAHVTLHIATSPEPLYVRADSSQLGQVLVNLVRNATEAMPDGGEITIATEPLEIAPARTPVSTPVGPGVYAVLSVSDTGIGMCPATQARVFEPFFTTKPVGAGSGLGLATAHGIINQSGGDIAVESAPGEGATFRVYLPRITPDAPAKPPGAAASAAGPASRVLVVEPERMLRGLICLVLRERGYDVLEASGEADALAHLEPVDERIDLLITDPDLAAWPGDALVAPFRARWPNIAVLHLRGYAAAEPAHGTVAATGTAVLDKPFDPQVLATRVRQLLARQVE